MSRALPPADFGAELDRLTRRLGVLERRLATRAAPPTADATGDDGHDGAGTSSVLVQHSGETDATADGDNAAAVGPNSHADAENSAAFGHIASVDADGGFAGGYWARVHSFAYNGTALGPETHARGQGATAAGYRADAIGAGSGAFCEDSSASGIQAIALGYGTQANHGASVAVGSVAQTTADNQIMLGAPGTFIACGADDGLVIRSPDGTQWRITVDNAGALAVAAA
jgi:hypothetical protein